MVFSSLVFLLFFLPVVLLGNSLLTRRWQNVFLFLASLLFYAWGETVYVGVMLVSIGLNYIFGRCIGRAVGSRAAFWAVTGGIAANLMLLGYFKYSLFLANALAPILPIIGLQPMQLEPVHLPIGISFFTFQAISYLVDVYRREVPVQKNCLDLGLYISLFPQLIAGPIIRYHDVALALRQRQVNAADFSYGVGRFVQGLAKKILIANVVAGVADPIFELQNGQLTTPLAWLGIVGYTLQIYYDFSGYSDMAIGLGRMFGFHYLENFEHPYIAQSVREFWQRWHISLSNWFRDYLYIPLGGNRKGPKRTYANLFTVFLLCGLWHGASWNFVLWGALHGVFLVIERAGFGGYLQKCWRPLRHFYLLLFITISWVVFRSETLAGMTGFFAALFGLTPTSGNFVPVFFLLTPEVIVSLLVGIVLAVPWPLARLKEIWLGEVDDAGNHLLQHAVLVGGHTLLLLLSLMYLSVNSYNPFIYFRF